MGEERANATLYAPCELLRHREPTGRCRLRSVRGHWQMVPVAPLLRYLGMPGWDSYAHLGHPIGGRFTALPGTWQRALVRARLTGWMSEQTADGILSLFGDGDLARVWWGDSPASSLRRVVGPMCPSCGAEMLTPAERCGFCMLDERSEAA